MDWEGKLLQMKICVNDSTSVVAMIEVGGERGRKDGITFAGN